VKRNAGDDCAKTCLESCKSKGESFETSGKSYETSCDSVTEDCDGEDSVSKDSPKCGMENRNCDCASKEEKSAECMTLCSSEYVESSSCEGAQSDCTTSVVPTISMKLERTRTRNICEIWDPHYRRQLKRLAKMRAISAVSSSIATSRVDVVRPTTSHHGDRITSKKLYNLLITRLPYSKNKRLAEYLKKPVDDKLNGDDKDWSKQRKQVYRQAKRQLGEKFSGKLTQGTTIVSRHRTRGVTPFRHSQIKRISEKEKTISA